MTSPQPDIAVDRPPAPRRLRRSRVLLWLALVFAATLLLAGAVLYTERLSVVERIFRGALAERGLDAELEVESLSLTELVLKDVVLREDGTEVLRARRLRAGYRWREATEGVIRRVDVEGAVVRVGLDEDLRITDGWLQPSGGGGGLPYEGVGLEDSEVDLRTPYGDLDIEVEAEIASLESLTAALRLRPTDLAYGGWQARVGGPAEIGRDGSVFTVDTAFDLPSLSGPDTALRDGDLSLDGRYDLTAGEWTGDIAARFASGTVRGAALEDLSASGTPAVTTSPLRLDGPMSATLAALDHELGEGESIAFQSPALTLTPDSLSGPVDLRASFLSGFEMEAESFRASGEVNRLDWSDGVEADAALDLSAARLGLAPALARRLADSVTVRGVLEAAPVTRDFAGGLADEAARALRGGELDAPVRVRWNGGREVSLRGPARWGDLRVRPTAAPLYRFREGTLDASADLTLPGARGLFVEALEFSALSENGLGVETVNSVTARIQTDSWTAETPDGRATTVAPASFTLDVLPARTRVEGGLSFTGDIPGGYVEDLRADGLLEIRPGTTLETRFVPTGPVAFARLLTPDAGTLEDFTATLTGDDPVFVRRGDGPARIATGLEDASFRYRVETEAGEQVVDITASGADVTGTVADTAQNWRGSFRGATLDTDTLLGTTEAGEGTTATLPEGAFTARLREGEPLRFAFEGSRIDAATPLTSVAGMRVEAEGTLADYEVVFGGGEVGVPATVTTLLTALPIEGTARFRDGRWTGSSTASLEGAARPIDVEFDYGDGGGTAHIVVEDYRFSPDGLQPQDLVPALRGKIAEVSGPVDAEVTVTFRDGEVVSSPGTVSLRGLDLGTAPGPVTGLRTELSFASLLPLESTGRQTATLERFDPGIPLNDGMFEFEFRPEGIRIHDARWPLGDGTVRLDPLLWRYGAEVNRAELVVEGVPVGAFLENIGGGRILVDGVLSGRLPVEVSGVSVVVRDGRLEVPDGGVIRYETPQTDTAAAQDPIAQVAFDALREFPYTRLGLSIDGPLDGEITVDLGFRGAVGQRVKLPLPGWVKLRGEIPFEFDISVTGELFNLMRSLTRQYTDPEVLREFNIIPESAPEASP